MDISPPFNLSPSDWAYINVLRHEFERGELGEREVHYKIISLKAGIQHRWQQILALEALQKKKRKKS